MRKHFWILKDNIILIPKSHKHFTHTQKNDRPISLMNIDQSILSAVGSDLQGEVLVNGSWFWVIHGLCLPDALWGQEVRCLQDCAMVKGPVWFWVQYRLVLTSPLHLVDVCVFLQVALSTGSSISSVKWTALRDCGWEVNELRRLPHTCQEWQKH